MVANDIIFLDSNILASHFLPKIKQGKVTSVLVHFTVKQ